MYICLLHLYKGKISDPILRARETYATEGEKQRGKKAKISLQLLLSQILIRRTQADVLKLSLPPRQDITIYCCMMEGQREQYDDVCLPLLRYVSTV